MLGENTTTYQEGEVCTVLLTVNLLQLPSIPDIWAIQPQFGETASMLREKQKDKHDSEYNYLFQSSPENVHICSQKV